MPFAFGQTVSITPIFGAGLRPRLNWAEGRTAKVRVDRGKNVVVRVLPSPTVPKRGRHITLRANQLSGDPLFMRETLTRRAGHGAAETVGVTENLGSVKNP